MKKRMLWLATVVVTAVVSSLATVAIAGTPRTTGAGTHITRVKTVAQDFDWGSTSSTTFTDIPGASRTINVSGESALLLTRFSAQESCRGSVPFDACSVRIVVDDGSTITPMEPDFAHGIDSVTDCKASSGTCSVNEGFEYRTIEQFLTVGPGTYTVKAQFAVQSTATTLIISGGEFTLERFE